MKYEPFHYSSLKELKAKFDEYSLPFYAQENTDILFEKVKTGSWELKNRFVIQPMEGCDGTAAGEPGELTKRRYHRFAESGAALIWMEAVSVAAEGRANPRQLYICGKTADSFKRLTESVKEICMKQNGFEPMVILQATHSGRQSKPGGSPAPVIAYHNPVFEKEHLLNHDCIISDDALKKLEERFGYAVHLAQMAGFDGVDIKCCHGYLANELLSAFSRPGAYGGSFENRFRLIGQLHKMGANIDFVSNRARIIGVTKLHGANVVAWDLRSGAGLVVAAAMADGKTRIEQENLIERGYENLVSRVSEIGIRAKKCL